GVDLLIPNSTIFYDEISGICFGQKKYNLSVKGMPSLPLSNLLLLSSQSTLLQQLCICIKLNWIVLLNGPRLNGKSSVVETLGLLGQSSLKRMRLNKETDASELLGSYEQVLDYKIIEECFDEFCNILENPSVIGLPEEHSRTALKDLKNIEKTDVHKLRCKIIQIAALVNAESQEKLNIIASKLSKVYLRFEWRSSVFVEAYKNGF
uniref:Uncharacterized protein n=1 Tax=Panagrolaimus sp. PS1159 TaxID=55785 RepID=A0AC35ET79_9BILA